MAVADKDPKRSRTGLIIYLNKLFDNVEKKLDSYDGNLNHLISVENLVVNKFNKVIELSEVIAESVEDPEQLQQEIEESVKREVDFTEKLTILREFIASKQSAVSSTVEAARATVVEPSKPRENFNKNVKLPKMTVQEFSGNPEEWISFNESFEAVVHTNRSLSNIEKFQYLKSYLVDEAADAIKGLRLSAENYDKAREMLEERFGDKQVLISHHMSQLLDLQSCSNVENVKELRKLYDSIEFAIRNLKTLGLDQAEYGPMLSPILLNKIPVEIKLIVSRTLEKNQKWDISKIMKTFLIELEAREKVFSAYAGESAYCTGASLHVNSKFEKPKRDNSQKREESSKPMCIFCRRGHRSRDCDIITKPEIRRNILQKENRCFICMKIGHRAQKCSNKLKCYNCRGRHHVAVCSYKSDSSQNSSTDTSSSHQKEEKKEEKNLPKIPLPIVPVTSNFVDVNKADSVLLKTARAEIFSTDQKHSKNARLLFDDGSMSSYVTKELCKELHLKPIAKQRVEIKTFGENKEVKELDVVQLCVKSKHNRENLFVEAFVSDICLPIENQNISLAKEQYEPLKFVELADSNPRNLPMKIDVLIGSAHYWNFIGNKQIRCPNGPTALESKLGYVLSGPVASNDTLSSKTSNFLVTTHALKVASEFVNPRQEIRNHLHQIYETDDETPSDPDILKTFNETTIFRDGRYEVQLPFKSESIDTLGDNYNTCRKRLRNLTKTFKNNPDLLQEYASILENQESLGVIERVEPNDYKVGETHYLPHRAVIQEQRETTKVRVVFDASCKSGKDAPSLNDVLESGPSLTPLLQDVLMRFRSFNYLVVADIEKAFLNIALAEEHQDYVRFLWFRDTRNIDFEHFEQNDLIEYRIKRVLFGVTSSPFLLAATLIKHISPFREDDPDFADTLLSSLHVDDLNAGKNTITEAFSFYKKAKECLSTGGFNLRKFKSNSPELEQFVKESYPDEEKQVASDDKVLGLDWNKQGDQIVFDMKNIAENFVREATKRTMLSSIASVYDPLGLINPLVVKMKTLFRKTCEQVDEWDQQLPDHLSKEWNQLIDELIEAGKVVIDRNYCFNDPEDPIESTQLHAFSDASENFYSTAMYLRFVTKSKKVTTNLVTGRNRFISAKAKASKKMSMPRAELNGILLMSETFNDVKRSFETVYSFDKIVFWTDSTVAHTWVKNDHKTYKKYVQSRLKKIRKVISNESLFKLVPSKLNPSDINTRGLKPSEMTDNELWFKGPAFLNLKESLWPNLKVGDKFTDYDIDAAIKEEEVHTRLTSVINLVNDEGLVVDSEYSVNHNSVIEGEYNLDHVIPAEKFSKLSKLLRTTALVLMYIKKLKKKHNKEELKKSTINNKELNKVVSSEEFLNSVNDAKRLWIRHEQSKLTTLKNFSQLKLQLGLRQDEHLLWRCEGRLQLSELDYNTKHPYLLPKSKFSELVVYDSHLMVKHNGVRDTLNYVRREYWITQPRNFVRSVIKRCTTCRTFEGKPYSYPLNAGPLPRERVTKEHAFSKIGIDYAGPIYVRDIYSESKTLHKAWVVLITCTTTRCLYLDIVSSCYSSGTINVLNRFFSSYGCPKKAYSDNGTYFASEELQTFAKFKGISWKFNIQEAPWYGGIFERMVRCVKRCLKKILRRSNLNYDEMITILKEIQNVLNNRPLTFLYTDDLTEPLTPNKLLYGRNIYTTNVDDPNDENVEDESVENRFHYVKQVLEHFWKRWQFEYLTELREYNKCTKKVREFIPKVNDVVLVYDKDKKRLLWRMGRIEKLITSADGRIRAAEVAVMSNGRLITLKRPITKLYPVEIDESANGHYSKKDIDETNTVLKFVDEKDITVF